MKKSRKVALTFLGSMAMAIGPIVSACGGHAPPQALHCVDPNNVVVQEANCGEGSPGGGGAGVGNYHWYYGGGGYFPMGSRISGGSASAAAGSTYKAASGTVRGGLGSTAHGGSSGGS